MAELNQTFMNRVKEAQAHADAAPSQPNLEAAKLAVALPRYQRARLVGNRRIAELAQSNLLYQSERLHSGSYTAVKFAMELLVSHLGKAKVGDIVQQEGRNTLSLISQLSPNVRKYREGQKARLTELVKLSRQVEPDTTLAPQTQARI